MVLYFIRIILREEWTRFKFIRCNIKFCKQQNILLTTEHMEGWNHLITSITDCCNYSWSTSAVHFTTTAYTCEIFSSAVKSFHICKIINSDVRYSHFCGKIYCKTAKEPQSGFLFLCSQSVQLSVQNFITSIYIVGEKIQLVVTKRNDGKHQISIHYNSAWNSK